MSMLQVMSTVLVPATAVFPGQGAYDLVGLAALKADLGVTDRDKDDLFISWIGQASTAATKYCDRKFAIERLQDRIFPPRDGYPLPVARGGEAPLQLSRAPVATVPSLAGTAPPFAPTLGGVAGGSLPGTYYVRTTYVTPTGETAASPESWLTLVGGLLQVAAPGPDSQNIATGWNCYVGTAANGEILQNNLPLALGTPFTLTALGTAGVALPPYVLVVENDIPLAEGIDFIVDADAGRLVRLDINQWPRRWPALRILVQYPAGYDLDDIADVQDAVIRMVKARWRAQTRDPAVRSTNIPGVFEETYWFAAGPGAAVGNMTPDVSAILDKYRVPVFG